MNTNTGTVTVWQSGRLAPHVAARRFDFGREAWTIVALSLLSVVVLALYVAVLVRDVDRSEMQHDVQRARAVAEAQCEADQPADLRGRCIALFNGDVVAAAPAPDATPDNTAYDTPVAEENAARATTVSLVANAR